MLELPLEATPNQEFLVVLGDQDCTIALYQRGARLYLDLAVGGAIVRRGAICQAGERILQGATDAFAGQLYFIDERSQPNRQAAPQWRDLGTRWRLLWLAPDEVEALKTAEFEAALNGE